MPFSSVHMRASCTLLIGFCWLSMTSGCGSNGNGESANPPSSGALPDGKSSADRLAAVEIPKGSPDELFAYIASLDTEPLPEDVADRGEALRELMTKRVKACDAILSQDVAPEAESSAVQLKLDALRTLSIVDPDGVGADFNTYVTSLIAGSDPYLARLAKAKQFQNVVNDYVSLKSEDSSQIVEQLNELLGNESAGPRVFMEARDAIGWLVPSTEDQLTTEQLTSRMSLVSKCYRGIGDRFSDFGDKDVAGEAKGLLALSDQFELELLGADARGGDKSSIEALVAKLKQMFAADTKHGSELGFTIQTAQGLEFDGLNDPAMQLYQLAWKNVKSSKDDGLRDSVRRTFEKASTRLNLVGRPMVIGGVLSDGSAFDWKQYNGKHVVVCFWESWVAGWQDHVKGMREAIAQYGDKNVEIVTVNLDKPSDLKEYLANHRFDLPVVASGEHGRAGTDSPTAIRYGVDMLPFTVLVGPDGKVVRIHVFGTHLSKALEVAFAK